MAEVFLATRREDPDGPLLVVKRILPHLQERSDFVQMFVDEARLTSKLFHANLVRVHDRGKAEGVHYIAMEFVDGLSLSLVLRRQPGRRLPLILGCYLVAEICAALDYAHTRTDDDGRELGIVHRDVSPDNILISKTGEVKLADFGIAKAKIHLTRTRPGQLKGKYSYMSPEQGMRLQIDHRSDIFSAGLVLYEVTTGHRVFPTGNEVETLRALYDRRYRPPETVVEDYPPPLAAVVSRALDWNPDRRYQRAADLRGALLELVPTAADPSDNLAVLVQCLRDQMQLVRPTPADQRTKQAAPLVEVVIPAHSQRETLLGVGEKALLPAKRAGHHDTVRDVAPLFEPPDPPISDILFPGPDDPLDDGGALSLDDDPPPGNDTEQMPALDFGEPEPPEPAIPPDDLDDQLTNKLPRLPGSDDDWDPHE